MNLQTSNKFEIDSFTLKIASEKVKNISNILNTQIETTSVNLNNGLVIEELTSYKTIRSHYTSSEEIPTTYEVRNYFNNSKNIKKAEEFYLIKVTSKHLRSRYFEGITKENIKLVYNSIMDQNIIFVDYENFLSADTLDIDFKKDQYNELYQDFYKIINNITIPRKEVGLGIKSFNKSNNQGFQFGTRKYATETLPYIKYYNKYLQSKLIKKNGGMLEFKEKYLSDIDFKNLFRVEYTIKGKTMFQRLGLSSGNKLIDVLNIPNEIKEGVAKDIFSKHTERVIPTRRINTRLTAKQKTALMIKDLSIKLGYSISQIEQYIKGYNLRYESEKSLLNDISKIDFNNEEEILNIQLENNNQIERLLNEIGIT
jgi:hypothetical protein